MIEQMLRLASSENAIKGVFYSYSDKTLFKGNKIKKQTTSNSH
ncbi:hypothetical protein ALTERO38_90032 [Alteromonas sp. 38]|nr:hypothetical protein ALTER154_10415 [Alteromonas sp. 154]VXC45501.1 hypothetical protein ALTERO38_90032 [Alteromonas sp. 38]